MKTLLFYYRFCASAQVRSYLKKVFWSNLGVER